MTPAPERPEALRARHIARRRALPPEARAAAAQAAAAHLPALLSPLPPNARVAAYAPRAGELDVLGALWPLATTARLRLVLPRVDSPGLMSFVEVASPQALTPGAFGILSPAPQAEIAPIDTISLFLVPGLAFDRQGGRVGMGGGYYDRALDAHRRSCDHRARFVGVGYAWQRLEGSLPLAPHDVRMDALLSDEGLWTCTP